MGFFSCRAQEFDKVKLLRKVFIAWQTRAQVLRLKAAEICRKHLLRKGMKGLMYAVKQKKIAVDSLVRKRGTFLVVKYWRMVRWYSLQYIATFAAVIGPRKLTHARRSVSLDLHQCIISADESPSVRIESFAITVNLRGCFNKAKLVYCIRHANVQRTYCNKLYKKLNKLDGTVRLVTRLLQLDSSDKVLM